MNHPMRNDVYVLPYRSAFQRCHAWVVARAIDRERYAKWLDHNKAGYIGWITWEENDLRGLSLPLYILNAHRVLVVTDNTEWANRVDEHLQAFGKTDFCAKNITKPAPFYAAFSPTTVVASDPGKISRVLQVPSYDVVICSARRMKGRNTRLWLERAACFDVLLYVESESMRGKEFALLASEICAPRVNIYFRLVNK